MKRDLDLCREILLAIEASAGSHFPRVEIPGFSREQVEYHERLMADAGLVIYDEMPSGGPSLQTMMCFHGVRRLTWQGHEFLDAARQPDRWQKAKSIIEKAGGYTFDVLKAVLIDLLKKNIGI